MKAASIILVLGIVCGVLWYVSGIIFIFFLGLITGLVTGMVLGSILNDWFETTSFYKWNQKRKESKVSPIA